MIDKIITSAIYTQTRTRSFYKNLTYITAVKKRNRRA